MAAKRDPILDVLPPPFEWCEIPGVKQFRLTTDEGDKGTYDISLFYMAKYQTTFEQFQVFVDDPQGFTNPAWRQGLAVDENQREAPGTQYFTHDRNLPRENVSWYDAVAFCRWLSSQVGYEVRLPTEWEWQWAAQGPDDREYPWGNEFDESRCNSDESGIGQTTPVTQYPNGEGPFHVMDMAGNIWEWCLNGYEDAGRVTTTGDAMRVVRGGAWRHDRDNARCSYRGGNDPDDRNSRVGFRVCMDCAPSL